MPNPFFSKKPKSNSQHSNVSSNQSSTTDSMDTPTIPSSPSGSSNPIAPPPPPTTTTTSAGIEAEALYREVYQCAKLNSEWYHVSKCLKEHPEWLLRVPEGRKWTMLHQIVFSGNVAHVKEVLSYQINNPQFSLLHKSVDEKTVKDVSEERKHVYQAMDKYIDTLIALDRMLNYAVENRWDDVIQVVRERNDIVNDKPPYRKYYLVHIVALNGDVDVFKKIHEIVPFDLTLKANDKTALEIAKEKKHIRLVNHIESLPPPPPEPEPSTSSTLPPHRRTHQYSPGFYEDISISILPANIDFSMLTSSTLGGHHGHGGSAYGHSHTAHHLPVHHTVSMPAPGGSSGHYSGGGGGASGYSASAPKVKSPKPKTTMEEDIEYEKKVLDNVDKVSGSEITNLITCPITKQIMRDPVIAADGFTYEHTAILEWFNTSNRSPMTNQPLDNFDLKPNIGIKSLLKTLEDSGKTSKK